MAAPQRRTSSLPTTLRRAERAPGERDLGIRPPAEVEVPEVRVEPAPQPAPVEVAAVAEPATRRKASRPAPRRSSARSSGEEAVPDGMGRAELLSGKSVITTVFLPEAVAQTLATLKFEREEAGATTSQGYLVTQALAYAFMNVGDWIERVPVDGRRRGAEDGPARPVGSRTSFLLPEGLRTASRRVLRKASLDRGGAAPSKVMLVATALEWSLGRTEEWLEEPEG